MPAKIKATPQSQFVNGINRLSKSARAGKKFKNGKLRFAKKAPKAKAAAAERKIGKFYAPEDATEKKFNRRTPKTAKLRSSIKEGTVLILLAGRHRGKRVVFLKQLPSGLLLVTGPFAFNGVPVRRVNQAYVIATSTVVDGVNPSTFAGCTDDDFKRVRTGAAADAEADFLAAGKVPEVSISDEKKALQNAVDAGIVKAASDDLKGYLHSRFSLSKADAPHDMVF